ncbi:MAG: hypothetical protein ABIJ92_02145 [Candidatus Aenigmatarchaeota archaeon]
MAIIDVLVNLLCQGNTVSTCTQFIQQQPNELYQLFFFFFFPTVFIILFIFILSDAIGSFTNKGIRLILAIAFYMFIVLSNWYSIILTISQFWYIAVIIIFGTYVFFKKFMGGGRSSGGMPGVGGGAIGQFAKGQLTEVFTHDQKDMRKEIEDAFMQLEHDYNEIKGNPKGTEARRGANAQFEATQTRLRGLITSYAKYGKIGKVSVTGQAAGFWKKYTQWSEKHRKIN